jgi:hypothetical protein
MSAMTTFTVADKDFVGIEIAFLGPGDQVCVVNFREIRRACSRGERRLPGRAAAGRIRRSGRETRRDPRHEQRGVDCGLWRLSSASGDVRSPTSSSGSVPLPPCRSFLERRF